MADDFYAELGVSKTASADEIRRAYRKLARQHHPDVNPGKPEAEERFKRIAAAYEVLSNKEKRALYDEFGEQSLQSGFDPEQARAYRRWQEGRRTAGSAEQDIPFDFDLSDLFRQSAQTRGGRGAAGADLQAIAGEDIAATVELDFVSALRGAEVEARIPMRRPCDLCAGSGEQPGSTPETCPECDGTGRVQAVRGPMRLMTTCPRCGGDGKVHQPCERCHGVGVLASEELVRVRIPAGADDGSELRVRGKGTPGLFGGPPGDLLIQTRVRPHPYFRREGLDLFLRLPITLHEAYSGATVEVPTPTGPVRMKVPPHTQQGAKQRLKGKGVQRGTSHGDLYVELEVRLPDADDPALSEPLAATERFYTRPVREGVQL